MNTDMDGAIKLAASEVQATEDAEFIAKVKEIANVNVSEGLAFRFATERETFAATAMVSVVSHPTEDCTRSASTVQKGGVRPNVVIHEIDKSTVVPNNGQSVKRKRGENPYVAHIDELGFYKGPEKQIINASNGITTSFLNDSDVQNAPTNVGEIMNNLDAPAEAATAAMNETQTDRTRLYKDEEWQREGNNKKWRRPGIAANRKKMAKASKKRNRR